MKRHLLNAATAVALLLGLSAFGGADRVAAAEPGHQHVANGAASEGVTSLDVYAEGRRVHVLIATKAGAAPAELQYLRSDDGGETFAAPVVVGAGQPGPEPAHRGADAQIAAAGDRLVAVWTTEGTEDRFGRGPMATAYSADGGKTWSAGPDPADDGTASGHAFVDVAADADGAFHVVWLDGRVSAASRVTGGASLASTQPSDAGLPSTRSSGKGLRYARSADGGKSWSTNVTLDPATCECCWNTIKTAANGKVYVLYRDRDPRDMGLVTSDDGGATWGRPVTVGNFGWGINGCPHVGGGLGVSETAGDGRVYAVVWTAKDEAAHGAYALASGDGGKTWGEAVRLGDSRSWHADVVCAGGEVFAVWDAYVDGGTAVFTAKSSDGKAWSAPVRLSGTGESATHPRVVRTPAGVRAFWTVRSGDGPVRWVGRKLD
jgi:hypothetical protein